MFHAKEPGTRRCIICGKEAKGLVVEEAGSGGLRGVYVRQ